MIASAPLVSLIVAVCFAAGLNLYVTMLVLGLMGHFHYAVLPPGITVLQAPWCIGASALLFAAEFVADKIPGLDLVWNALHTVIRIPAAALLAYAAGSGLSPEMHAVVTVAGAGLATLAHGSKLAARVAVTPSPEPVSNVTLSSAEDAAALGIVYAALHHPIVTGCTVALVGAVTAAGLCWGMSKLWRIAHARYSGWRRRPRGFTEAMS